MSSEMCAQCGKALFGIVSRVIINKKRYLVCGFGGCTEKLRAAARVCAQCGRVLAGIVITGSIDGRTVWLCSLDCEKKLGTDDQAGEVADHAK